MLQAVIYYIVTMILTKELVMAQCTIYHLESPGESCEDIYNKNPQSHDTSGYYWILAGPRIVYCGMNNYTGSSCEDVYKNNPETGLKPGYYCITESQLQWTYCNMTAIAIANANITISGDFITTCVGVGGGWRRIVNINISAGDDCPGEWRKATHSNVSFCRVASDDWDTCSSVSFSTNGISYQRVCGRARGYQKGDTVAFCGSHSDLNRAIDESYVSGLSITYSSNPRQHIWTFATGSEKLVTPFNCPCSINGGFNPPSYVGSNYYCESGTRYLGISSTDYFNDPLWDGERCVDNCCDDIIYTTIVLSSPKFIHT